MSLLTDNDSQLIVSCKVEHSRHVSSPGLDRVIKTTPSTSAVACYTIDTHTSTTNLICHLTENYVILLANFYDFV